MTTSNNYHTQMNPNLLNDIATSNQFMAQTQKELINNQLQQELINNQLQQEKIKLQIQNEKLKQEELQYEQTMKESNIDEIDLSDINSKMVSETPPKIQKQIIQPLPEPPSFISETTIADYILMPILLSIIFILLIHPTFSTYLDKYLPPMDNLKGYICRGLTFGVLYMIIRFGVTKFYPNYYQKN